MNRLYSFALLYISVGLLSCNKDGIKPNQLEGHWQFESGTYQLTTPNGSLQTADTLSGDLGIEKESIKFYSRPPYGPTYYEYKYKRDGKLVTLESQPSTTRTMEIKELTSNRLVAHFEYISGAFVNVYDTVYKR
ncbi:lipocalin family protein [Hymenobacter sp. AT01-02]|uniref:lipocalin family protein n=1 Tax=Hymenobacter sp. AT01-02 TaxID=1571877 RepID=UPI0005F1A674